jgi:hypothetical protein
VRGHQGRQRACRRDLWAYQRVRDAAAEGTLPVEVLDGLLHDPEGDAAYREFVAAGPLEDVLQLHAREYGPALARLCRRDPVWCEAMAQVWLYHGAWEALPTELRRLIGEPVPVEEGEDSQREND